MSLEKHTKINRSPKLNTSLARSIFQRKRSLSCTGEQTKNKAESPASQYQKTGNKESQSTHFSTAKNRIGIPENIKIPLEQVSGIDLSGVHVHYNSSQPAQLNALAYTQGQDIYIGSGQEKYLPHESWHVVQQMQGRVQPTLQINQTSINDDVGLEREADIMGNKTLQVSDIKPEKTGLLQQKSTSSSGVMQRTVHYIAQTSQRAELRYSPGLDQAVSGNFAEIDSNERIIIESGIDLELLDSQQEWIEVMGEAVAITELGPGFSERPAGTRTGWIRRDETNLAPSENASIENLLVAQDLDNLLDAELLPAMLSWESGVRTQGQAYASAYQQFSDTLTQASLQAKARADFYAAVLTTVSVGALGWIGDAAMSASSVTRILRSEALRGSIEDALQTGLGEAVDIAQGGWFTQQINSETHPLRYLNGALRALADTKRELISHVGTAKMQIGRTTEPVDRVRILVNMYEWWDTAQLRLTPNITSSNQQPMALEFERGFWAQYIKEDLIRIAPLPYYNGWTLHTYYHPESAVETRLDQLGISTEAGIDEWDAWYEFTDTDGPRDIDNFIRAIGSSWTQRLYTWATNYTPTTYS